jgi:hypothetical protein
MGSDLATTSEAPIACTLSVGDYEERLAQIAELARNALRSYEKDDLVLHLRKDDLVLHLRYDAAAADRVEQMIRRERECCAFLTFVLQEEGDAIVVTISAPEQARVAAETLFEQFVAPAKIGKPARVALVCACAATACAAVCVAPLVLPAVVLAGMGTMLAWLAGAQGWMTGLALLTVAAAWLWVWREAGRLGMRPSPSALHFMGVATFLLALALVWPLLEPQVARALGH